MIEAEVAAEVAAERVLERRLAVALGWRAEDRKAKRGIWRVWVRADGGVMNRHDWGPCQNLDQMAWHVEPVLEARGLRLEYMTRLHRELNGKDAFIDVSLSELFNLVTAPAEVRARAALAVLAPETAAETAAEHPDSDAVSCPCCFARSLD